MSEDGEIWAKIKKDNQEKRWRNDKNSIEILKQKGIEFKVLNKSLSHYLVGGFNFWATTGKFYNQKTGEKGRGIFNLIKQIYNIKD